MFQGFTKQTIDFLWNIRFNNNKSWFEDHKDEYNTVLKKPMKELAEETYNLFTSNHDDLSLGLHIARIYRDARRPNPHGPYKDRLWFTIRQHTEEWTDKPTFWFELAPESWCYGVGYYNARPQTMENLRARIDNEPKTMLFLNRELERQTEFVIEGSDYARPKCDPEKPLAVWYNKKSFSIIHEEKISEAVFSPDLVNRLSQGFTFLVPFFKYFLTLDED